MSINTMQVDHYGVIEAEDFTLTNGFEVVRSNWMWGDYVKVPTKGSASMQTVVDGVPGVYDLVVYYWDSTIGAGQTSVVVDGKTLSSWSWNKQLGSKLADVNTYTTRVIPNVEIKDGSVIKINGVRGDADPLFIDKIMLEPAANRLAGKATDAFPGAEGFGSETVGGRGGWIVKVTNLNDSGEGSLRWALEEIERPRIVVFDVGGVITLKDNIKVKGDVTVAGQTAPGDGVTIRGAAVQVVEDNVIIRGLKFRPGDGPGVPFDKRDAIAVGSAHTTVNNVIIDGNSFSWATDEVVNVWFGARNITISNNIIAEALSMHSMGVLIGDKSSNITLANNLIMSSEFRNPTISDATNVEVVNNYVYNYGKHGLSYTMIDGFFTRSHVLGNHFERGPGTTSQQHAVRLLGAWDDGAFWVSDNISHDRPDSSYPDRAVASGALATIKSGPVFTPSDVSVMPVEDVRDYVLAHAGARGQGLDKTDARLIAEAENGGGGGLKSTPPAGAYSIPSNFSPLADRDGDGIPDVHEAAFGGNPNIFDPHKDSNGNGYSNIEEYINSLLPRPGPGPGPDNGGGAAPAPTMRVEAESFQFVRGFVAENRPIASGGQVIVSFDPDEAVARHVFAGAAGVYNLDIGYADENDGRAWMEVLVNGVEIDEWVWDKNLGSPDLNLRTLTEHRVAGVALAPGDVIELHGHKDGFEPTRTDYVDFTLIG